LPFLLSRVLDEQHEGGQMEDLRGNLVKLRVLPVSPGPPQCSPEMDMCLTKSTLYNFDDFFGLLQSITMTPDMGEAIFRQVA